MYWPSSIASRTIFLLAGVFAACASALAAQPVDVSMIQLIAQPEKFDGRLVRVIGFLHLEFEGDALYLRQEDFTRSIFQNGLWIDVDRQPVAARKLNDRYVLVEGTFSAQEKGHFGLWSGSLHDVSRLQDWSAPRPKSNRGRGLKQ